MNTDGPNTKEDPKDRIYADVRAERERQDEIWGGPEHDDDHSDHEWDSFFTKQIVALSASRPDRRERLIKLAALAFAAVESLDRRED